MTRSASAKVAFAGRPRHQRGEARRRVGAEPALGAQRLDLPVHPGDPAVDPALVEVGEDDRHLEAAGDEQGELARHQAGADDPDLGDRPSQRRVGRPGGLAGAALHEVERIQAGAQLVAHDEVDERLVLGGEGLLARAGAGAGHEVERPVGGGGLPAGALVGHPAGGLHRRGPRVLVARDVGAGHRHRAGQHPGGPGERLLEEVGGGHQQVGDAEPVGLRAGEHPVLAQGVLDDDGQRGGGPTSRGSR